MSSTHRGGSKDPADRSGPLLPKAVQQWAGLSQAAPEIPTKVGGAYRSIAGMNG